MTDLRPDVVADADQRAAAARTFLDRVVDDDWVRNRHPSNSIAVACLSVAIEEVMMTSPAEAADALALAILRLAAP